MRYLSLWDDGAFCRPGAEEGGEGRRHHHRVGPQEVAEVTAGDGVLLGLEHQRVHGVEAVPRQPHRALLAQEGGALKVKSQGGTAVRHQVKTERGRERGMFWGFSVIQRTSPDNRRKIVW